MNQHTAARTKHQFTDKTSPTHRISICSCGWQAQVSRRGTNARASISRLTGLCNAHLKEVRAAALKSGSDK